MEGKALHYIFADCCMGAGLLCFSNVGILSGVQISHFLQESGITLFYTDVDQDQTAKDARD